MTDVNIALRHKRYKVKNGKNVALIVETSTGKQFEFLMENCSLTGIGAATKESIDKAENFDINNIISSSKITWGNSECTLGRLVIKSIKEENGLTYVGFFTIDTKVPLTGSLSSNLDICLDDTKTPYDFELSPNSFGANVFNSEANLANVDLFFKTKQYHFFSKEWEKMPKYGYYNVRTASKGTRVKLTKTRKDGRNDYIIMGSNDYLGLAAHPEVIEAGKKAMDEYGFGSTGSPLSTGTTDIHEELCDFIAKLLHKEEVILFNSGYTANVGLLSGLTNVQDLIVADILSHASIQDGMQMSKATSRFFKHNSVEHLDHILTKNRNSYSGCLVVTEGVFSMDGDVPPLKEILTTARKHNARVMIDEAHSFGIVGPNGLGGCEKHHILNDVDIIMGTFSKLAGGIGGFIASTKDVTDWLWWFSRAHMFTVSIPPSTAAAALKALQLFKNNPEILAQEKSNIKHFANGLRNLGYKISPNHESSVFPVIIGDESKLNTINEVLMDEGVFVVPIVYPIVSKKRSRFRFTIMATHTTSDLDYVLNILEKGMKKANFKFEDIQHYLEQSKED